MLLRPYNRRDGSSGWELAGHPGCFMTWEGKEPGAPAGGARREGRVSP